jgi:hypothetical protein
LIAQLVRELQQVQVQAQARELALVLQPEQERALQLVPQPEQVQELRLVRELVPHLHHQQLQSRFQLQRSRLLQHEFLSTLQQLAKALLYQLCL